LFTLTIPFYLFTGCENELLARAELLQNGTILASKSPLGLTGVESNHQVSLSWQKVDGATGYKLYWSTNPDTPQASANMISVSGTSYTHSGLSNMTNLYYWVSALGYDAESRVSDPVNATPHQYMVYVNNGGVGGTDCNTAGYVLDNGDGSLVESTGSPFNVGSYPQSIAIDPLQRFAYTSSFNTKQITCYTLNQDTGALAPIGIPVVAGSGVSELAVDPSGKYLYAVNSTTSFNDGGSSISAYAINQGTGALGAMAGSPFAVGTDLDAIYQPQGLVIDQTGRFLYVTIYGTGDNVAVFDIDAATGTLTKSAASFGGSDVDSGVMGIALHPNGKFLYLTYWNNSTSIIVDALTLNTSTGGLLTGQVTRKYNLATQNNNAEVVEIDPTGRFLYIAIYLSNKIAGYSINQTTGELTPAAGSPFTPWIDAADYRPRAIGFDPAGKFAYMVASLTNSPYTGTVRTFSIEQSNGTLSAVGAPIDPGINSCDIAVVSLP